MLLCYICFSVGVTTYACIFYGFSDCLCFVNLAKTRRRLRRPTTAPDAITSSRENIVSSKKETNAPVDVADKRIDQQTSSSTTVRRTRVRSKTKHRSSGSTGTVDNALVASGSSLKGKKTKVDDSGKKIVCYYTNWSQYRTKIGKFVPEDIPADLCTHIIFAFGWLKKNKLSSYESNDETKDNVSGLYDRMMSLKKANPKLKVCVHFYSY